MLCSFNCWSFVLSLPVDRTEICLHNHEMTCINTTTRQKCSLHIVPNISKKYFSLNIWWRVDCVERWMHKSVGFWPLQWNECQWFRLRWRWNGSWIVRFSYPVNWKKWYDNRCIRLAIKLRCTFAQTQAPIKLPCRLRGIGTAKGLSGATQHGYAGDKCLQGNWKLTEGNSVQTSC